MTNENAKKTYTAVTRNRNSWIQDNNGENVEYQIIWDCGHKHRTPGAAEKCLEKMGGAACSFLAEIEDNNGSRVDSDGCPYA